MSDRVFRDKATGAWRCIVNGTVHGDWENRALAKAGMRVEQQRVQRRDVEAIANARKAEQEEDWREQAWEGDASEAHSAYLDGDA